MIKQPKNNERELWRQFFTPVFILFILVNSVCIFFSNRLDEKKIDHEVVLAANVLFFILAMINGVMRIRAIKNPNPNVYVRVAAAASFIKLFVSAIAAAIYLFTAGEKISVYGIIVALALYLFYMIIETKGAIKMTKKDGGS